MKEKGTGNTSFTPLSSLSFFLSSPPVSWKNTTSEVCTYVCICVLLVFVMNNDVVCFSPLDSIVTSPTEWR
jgi:hypothetical protein